MSALSIFAIVLGLLGILGSVMPGLPGPPLSWAGLLLVYLDKTTDPVSTTALVIWLAIVVLVSVLDYVLPATMTRRLGGHKAASIGAVAGLFIGMLIPPVGMILGSLLGAFIAEFLVADSGVWESFRASIGAFIGFMVTTLTKLVVSGILMWVIVAKLI